MVGFGYASKLGTLKFGLGNANVEEQEHGQLGNDDEGVGLLLMTIDNHHTFGELGTSQYNEIYEMSAP